jgi:cyanophycinase
MVTALLAGLLGCPATTPPDSAVPTEPVDTDTPDTAADTGDPDGSDTDPPVPTADTGVPFVPPAPPANLDRWMTGNPADAPVTPQGPGLILMGGGVEPDAAFTWWTPLVNGGDVVVIRTSGSDGYNDYLFSEIGGVDSVETLRVDTAAFANHAYVAWRIETAEAVFMAGGDQWTYLSAWKGTALEDAMHTAWSRGAVIGGTSAGLAVLGDRVFSAEFGTVYPDEVLDDPYNAYMSFEDDFLNLPPLQGWVTDSHFAERDRMGRLLGFVGRWIEDGGPVPARGIGVDEQTALVVGPTGLGEVVGSGSVYVIRASGPADTCDPGVPLQMSAQLWTLSAGDTLTLPDGAASVGSTDLAASGGSTIPVDPY